jgi:type II secretory pathway pseudopilin PulG
VALRNREAGFSLIAVIAFIAIAAVMIVVVVPNMSGTFGRSRERANQAELITVQQATDIWFLQTTNATFRGSAPGSRPVTSFSNIPALGGASLYPSHFKNPSAADGVGYCWDTKGKVTQKPLASLC